MGIKPKKKNKVVKKYNHKVESKIKDTYLLEGTQEGMGHQNQQSKGN